MRADHRRIAVLPLRCPLDESQTWNDTCTSRGNFLQLVVVGRSSRDLKAQHKDSMSPLPLNSDLVLSRKSRFLPRYEPLANLNMQVTLGQSAPRQDGWLPPISMGSPTGSPTEPRSRSPRMSPSFQGVFRRRSGGAETPPRCHDSASSDEYTGSEEESSSPPIAHAPPAARSDGAETRQCMLTRLESIDASRMRCKATVQDADGQDQILRIRFANPDAMEEWLASSPVALPHRHHRCSCCLEWVYADAARCTTCQQPLHQACAEKWLRKRPWCPNCRAEWKLKRSPMSLGTEDFLKGT